MRTYKKSIDKATAKAFAGSWNNLPTGSIYSKDQFEDWMAPITKKDVYGKKILELGCGNASLMMHLVRWSPKYICGVDLGDSVESGNKNMKTLSFKNWLIEQADLTSYKSDGFALVYCIGVLHHLKNPKYGFDSVIRNVKPGGRFHCWVYGKDGNELVIIIVDPLRKIVAHLPWWVTKYLIATPLAIPFYLYANFISKLKHLIFIKNLPLYQYCLWISRREFSFFRHVVFDQLVTPQTTYFDKKTIESWLSNNSRVDQKYAYIINRNGNSWKFGGRVR
ncbi:MAG: class I SAM-dependent methyltransferase [Patescibacteria group bacterium]